MEYDVNAQTHQSKKNKNTLHSDVNKPILGSTKQNCETRTAN